MFIKRVYKPWLLSDHGDSGRAALEHAVVERVSETSGRLVTSNAFSMGVFPVELEPGEQVGMVRASVLSYAWSFQEFRHVPGAPKHVEDAFWHLHFDGEQVAVGDGSRHPRLQAELNDGPFGWRSILEKSLSIDPAVRSFTIDPTLLRRAAVAIGAYHGIYIVPTHDAGPVILVPRVHPVDLATWRWEEFTAAFALVMPMRGPEGE